MLGRGPRHLHFEREIRYSANLSGNARRSRWHARQLLYCSRSGHRKSVDRVLRSGQQTGAFDFRKSLSGSKHFQRAQNFPDGPSLSDTTARGKRCVPIENLCKCSEAATINLPAEWFKKTQSSPAITINAKMS